MLSRADTAAHEGNPHFKNCDHWLRAIRPHRSIEAVARHMPKSVFKYFLRHDGSLPLATEDIRLLNNFIRSHKDSELNFDEIFNSFPSYIDHPENFLNVFKVAMGLEKAGFKIRGIFKRIEPISSEIDLIVSDHEQNIFLLEFKTKVFKWNLSKYREQFERLSRARQRQYLLKPTNTSPQIGLVLTKSGSEPDALDQIESEFKIPSYSWASWIAQQDWSLSRALTQPDPELQPR